MSPCTWISGITNSDLHHTKMPQISKDHRCSGSQGLQVALPSALAHGTAASPAGTYAQTLVCAGPCLRCRCFMCTGSWLACWHPGAAANFASVQQTNSEQIASRCLPGKG